MLFHKGGLLSKIETNPGLASESLVPIAKAGKFFPVPVSRPTVERLLRVGKNGVPLESFLIGSRRFTSKEAIARFLESTNAQRDENGRTRMSAADIRQKKVELGLD